MTITKTKKNEDRNLAIDFAHTVLDNKNEFVILDTETTGLGNTDVIVQIGIIDLDGNTLLDTLIKPTKKKQMPSDAKNIHGITMKMLSDAPSFQEVYPKFLEIIKNKYMLIYNAEFDGRLLQQTMIQDGNYSTISGKGVCIMKYYSKFIGNWSDYHNDYTYVKLPEGDHSSIGDCKATLTVINKMYNAVKKPTPSKSIVNNDKPQEKEIINTLKKWWEFWK